MKTNKCFEVFKFSKIKSNGCYYVKEFFSPSYKQVIISKRRYKLLAKGGF